MGADAPSSLTFRRATRSTLYLIPRTRARRWLATLVLVIGLGAIICYLTSRADELDALLDADPLTLIVLVGGGLVFLSCQSWLLVIVVRPYGVRLGPYEAMLVLAATFLANNLLPFLGVGLRALYLKKKKGLSYNAFAAGSTATVVVEVLIYSLTALISLLIIFEDSGVFDTAVLIVVGGVFVIAVLAFTVPSGVIRLSGAKSGKPLEMLQDWRRFFSYNSRAVPWILLATIIQMSGLAVMFWAAFATAGSSLPAVGSAAAAGLTDFALLIRVTPAAIGSFDAVVAYVGTMFDGSVAKSLAAALLVRGGMAVWFVPLGIIAYARVVGPIASRPASQ